MAYETEQIARYLNSGALEGLDTEQDDDRLCEYTTKNKISLTCGSPLNVKISRSTDNGEGTEIELDLADSTCYEQAFPRLEDMAAVRLALELWRYVGYPQSDRRCYWSRYRYCSICAGYERYIEKLDRFTKRLQAPECVIKRIKMLHRLISSEITHFSYASLPSLYTNYYDEEEHLDEYDLRPLFYTDEENHEHTDNEDNEDDYNLENINIKEHFFCDIAVWKTNNTIDERNTVRKVLSCRKQLHLYGDLVFKIIANYCMENEVKNFPITFLSAEFIQEVEKDQHSNHIMTYFWLKSKDPQYTWQPRDMFATLNNSLDTFIYDRKPLQWHAYEYFWNFLTEDEQLIIVKKLISRRYPAILREQQMNFFSKMTRNQLEKIYSQIPYEIISNFCSLREYELASASWQYAYVNSLINKEQFKKLIDQVLEEAKKTGEGTDFLAFLWSGATNSMIEYAKEKDEGHFLFGRYSKKGNEKRSLYELYFRENEALKDTVEFLAVMLLRINVEFRKMFILDMGLILLHHFDNKIFVLIDTCFSPDDQSEIKEKLLVKVTEVSRPTSNPTMRCFRKLVLWEIGEFYRYLSLFTSKANLQLRLKRRLLEAKMLKISDGFFTPKEWSNVSKILDESYSNREQARQRKKKLLYSSLNGCYIFQRWPQPNDEANFTVIDDILQSVLTETEIVSFKERVSICFQTALVKGYRPHFRKGHWRRFISWCYDGDERKISHFKNSFRIHEAFHSILWKTVEGYFDDGENCKSFFCIDELVRWKFPESKERRKFKELKIYDIMEINLRKLESARDDYGEVAEKFIQWSFEEDKAKIRQFKKRFSAEDRLKMIKAIGIKRGNLPGSDWNFFNVR